MFVFESSSVALLRRNRLLLALAIAPLFLGLASMEWGGRLWADAEAHATTFIWGLIAALAGAVTTFAVIKANPRRVAVPGVLSVDDTAVRFSGRPIAWRRSLCAGLLIPAVATLPLVRLERRWPRQPIDLRMGDEAEGRQLLRALGFDVSQGVASFPLSSLALASVWFRRAGGMMLLFIVVVIPVLATWTAVTPGVLALLALVCSVNLFVWLVLISIPARVVVGADGVLVAWLGRKRFAGYGQMRAVRPFGAGSTQGVSLWLSNGSPIKLPIKRQFTQALNQQQTILLTQRILDAKENYRQSRQDHHIALPERAQRSPEEWIRLLRAVGSGANADHRTAPIPREELFRIVEDPGAEPRLRANAAIALGAGLEDSERTRLRLAAEPTADPELRAVLEWAANSKTVKQM